MHPIEKEFEERYGIQMPTLLKRTVWYEDGIVKMLDRRQLPDKIIYLELSTYEEVAKAIEDMAIQGATAIARAAGYGMVLAVEKNMNKPIDDFKKALDKAAARLKQTRPTGSELVPLVDKMYKMAIESLEKGEDVIDKMVHFLISHWANILKIGMLTGQNASKLIDDGDTVLTHCWGGPAVAFMLLEAIKQGKQVKVVNTETRPYLQGARLTSLTLKECNIKSTLVTDNMPGYLMWKGIIKKVFTAADRIALDGSIANKIGTYLYAIAARHNGVPFYILGYEGPDPNTPTINDIPIEERNPEEIFYIRGIRVAPEGINGYYPAFDIVPPKYIDAIITWNGIYPPQNIREALKQEIPQFY
ncbi:MAG: s-methyl-5-thioribose-1-phosphate isomerase [Candidatus Odinarchaeota archaeon]|nr:s-methyl-5-thioribose-1-phosphate isomerase [Candidatus Odinarchaeota archaeon]